MICAIEIINSLIEEIWEIFEKEKIKCDVIIAILEEKDGVILIQFILFDRKRKIKNMFFVVIIDGEIIEVFTNLQEAQTFFRNKVQERRAVFLTQLNQQ